MLLMLQIFDIAFIYLCFIQKQNPHKIQFLLIPRIRLTSQSVNDTTEKLKNQCSKTLFYIAQHFTESECCERATQP